MAYIKHGREMNCGEIAEILGLSPRGVDYLEKNALKKLRGSPMLFLLYMEMQEQRRSNNIGTLSRDEY